MGHFIDTLKATDCLQSTYKYAFYLNNIIATCMLTRLM